MKLIRIICPLNSSSVQLKCYLYPAFFFQAEVAMYAYIYQKIQPKMGQLVSMLLSEYLIVAMLLLWHNLLVCFFTWLRLSWFHQPCLCVCLWLITQVELAVFLIAVMTEHRRYLTLLSLWIFSLVFVHCQGQYTPVITDTTKLSIILHFLFPLDSTTFSPVRAPCVGDTIEMVCSIQPPPSETFGGSVALVSINGSNPFTQVQLNSNSMLDGIDLSRYSANVDGLNPSTAMSVIRLIINSYLPLDSDTTFLCSTTFVNGSQYDSTMPDSPMPQAG